MARRSTFDAARDRVEFRLTYGETQPRRFNRGYLEGPDIPDAYANGMSSGEWFGDDPGSDDDLDVRQWWAHFAEMAVGEAVHEALEWFRVDGRPWLDPHGREEFAIQELVGELCRGLAALREGRVSPDRRFDEPSVLG